MAEAGASEEMKKSIFIIAFFFVFLICIISVSDVQAGSAALDDYVVDDRTGVGIPDVLVTLSLCDCSKPNCCVSIPSQSDGRFIFNSVLPGIYSYWFKKANYADVTGRGLSLEDGTRVGIPPKGAKVSMHKIAGNLSVSITDCLTDSAITGANVLIIDSKGATMSRSTYNGNSINAELLVSGNSYNFTARKIGYASYTETGIVIVDAQTTTKNICLNANCRFRGFDGTSMVNFACDPLGTLTSPLRIFDGTNVYGVMLVYTTDFGLASNFRVNTTRGVMALRKL